MLRNLSRAGSMTLMTAAKRIRVLLVEHDRKHRELAEHLGISPAALSQRLSGATRISDAERESIAAFFGVEVTEIPA